MKLRAPVDWKECKGIFVGGCVSRGEGSSFRAKAHCHNVDRPQYHYFGWICVRSEKRIGDFVVNSGGPSFDGEIVKPNQLLLHEYAHLLAPNQGHTPTFYRQLRQLGGHITKSDRYFAPKAVAKASMKLKPNNPDSFRFGVRVNR